VGELEMLLQAKLLRVIQERTFERVGGVETIKTDVRIISATNRDLKQAVLQKEFREDLYYRLNSFPILIPPLRQRRGDILILANHFLRVNCMKLGKDIKEFHSKANKLIYEYSWPGNIRELENTIERSIIISESNKINVEDLPSYLKDADGKVDYESSGSLFSDDNVIPFEKLKEESIRHALKVTNGNIVEAARKLQLGRATIYRLMEKYNIEHRSEE
jgi:DNA-binding NtrC family response regulator